ncbi:MAG: anthranilate phosphoribosyltransferase [Ignavibacteriales bacterium]|nr:MAG: anthranilate phosphoribosyltransferase [Ignavibacteriales bacterium]
MTSMYLKQLIEGHRPEMKEAYEIMNSVLSGAVSASLLSSLLTAMRMRGETPEEIAGFALAMRSNSRQFTYSGGPLVDLCGTGGDNSSTVNISTIASFIVAGTGIKVAKHGNRAVSGKCGSADILEELGCSIDLDDEQITECLNKSGFAFFFAPNFHTAMKHAAPVRRELGFRTVFNMLGPLTNPAGVKRQMTGTFTDEAARSLARAAALLDYEKIALLCTENSVDELLPGKEALVITVEGKKIREQIITPDYPSLSKKNPEGLYAATKEESKRAFLEVIDEAKESYTFSAAVINAAMTLTTARDSGSMDQAIEECIYALRSGDAYRAFQNYLKLSKIPVS